MDPRRSSVAERKKSLLSDETMTRKKLIDDNVLLTDTIINLRFLVEEFRKKEKKYSQEHKEAEASKITPNEIVLKGQFREDEEQKPKKKKKKINLGFFSLELNEKVPKAQLQTETKGLEVVKKMKSSEDIKKGEITLRKKKRKKKSKPQKTKSMTPQIKKFVNDPQNAVFDSLMGVVRANPHLKLTPRKSAQIITCDNQRDKDQHVALISGGGSGHEPAHALFVARGMLSAAVCGHVFTSPDVDSILTAIKMVCGKAGCLLIIKNYTGDRLNFKLAAQLAEHEGYRVKSVVVADDAAFGDLEKEKKRGLAGTCFVHKIAGAAAAAGKPLEEVHAVACDVVDSVSTMGVSFGPCAIPGSKNPMFFIPDDQMELGLGIHGEKGIKRCKIEPNDAIVTTLMKRIVKPFKKRRMKLRKARVALLVNNLGAVSQLEMFIIASKAIEYLEKIGCVVDRVFVGTLMTSLGMKGMSLSLLVFPKNHENEFMNYIDGPSECTVWPKTNVEGNYEIWKRLDDPYMFRYHQKELEKSSQIDPTKKKVLEWNVKTEKFQAIVKIIAKTMVNSEAELNRLDAMIGDGDCGSAIKRAGTLVLDSIGDIDCRDIAQAMKDIAMIVQTVGGTSGAVYCSLLYTFGCEYAKVGKVGTSLLNACDAVSKLGGAHEGDGTFLDALIPVARKLEESDDSLSFEEMFMYASNGAKSTEGKRKKKGRASYLGDRAKGCMDPGAKNIQNIFQNIFATMKSMENWRSKNEK